MMNLTTCNKCGWVYFAVTQAYIDKWHEDWKAYWLILDDEGRDMFGLPDGPPTTAQYMHCWCGNDYKNFRDTQPGDCPDGCTIGPIKNRAE